MKMGLVRIWELLNEAALEAMELGLPAPFVQCLIGLSMHGQFDPRFLKDSFLIADDILKKSTNKRLIKASLIILLFRLEQQYWENKQIVQHSAEAKQKASTITQMRYETNRIFFQAMARYTKLAKQRRTDLWDEEISYLIRIGQELTKPQLSLDDSLFDTLVFQAADWVGRTYHRLRLGFDPVYNGAETARQALSARS